MAIKEHLAGAGPENPSPAVRMRADDAASLATRPSKSGSFTPEGLLERWQAEADEAGFPTGHALEAQVTGRVLAPPALAWEDVVTSLVGQEEGLCAHRPRFKEAHVVERIAALGAGRLDVEDIEWLAADFLVSSEAVRLVERTGRRSAEYSTADHLALEERVLDHLDGLLNARVAGVDPVLVEDAIDAEEPGLGADQADAVRALCCPGPSIRSLIAPAGFGKTTTVHAGATAAGRAGYPVLGLAATNQAAGELRQAGIPAMTIARFALDGANLEPGTFVVLDEVSQVATADAEVVLAAVAATPAARLWCLGDPHQAQPVRAGGFGAELARLAAEGLVPAPALTENRRQLEPAERSALSHYRAGRVATSQAIRSQGGWEHDLESPHATREALADAVAADVAAHGPAGVVALAVTHADCEDLADRIRRRLREEGRVAGPEMSGPAWTSGERGYAAGDRILVHGVVRVGGRRLNNGSVVTVTAVHEAALQVVDDHGHALALPSAFVQGRRADGSPNCSHAWVRTIEGIQGGTWTQVHLLGTSALERFKGYVGQSRSRFATHTWNVSRLPEIDHGGVLADQRTPEREVLDALLRVPDTGFATHDDPRRFERLLAERAELQAVLRQRPPDRRPELRRVEHELRSAEKERYWATYRLHAAHEKLAALGPLSQMRRHGRHEKASLMESIERFQDDVQRAEGKLDRCEDNLGVLRDSETHRREWDTLHGHHQTRLDVVEAELAEFSPGIEPSGSSRAASLVTRAERPPNESLTRWAERIAEMAGPRLPGHDSGLGMDLGL